MVGESGIFTPEDVAFVQDVSFHSADHLPLISLNCLLGFNMSCMPMLECTLRKCPVNVPGWSRGHLGWRVLSKAGRSSYWHQAAFESSVIADWISPKYLGICHVLAYDMGSFTFTSRSPSMEFMHNPPTYFLEYFLVKLK
jgi:hypothetical protein